MGNMLEQAIPLIACLWMYGFYIDSARATSLGLVYVGVRALYPVLYAKWGRMTIGVEFCTQPMYCCIMYFFLALFSKVVGMDTSVVDLVPPSKTLGSWVLWTATLSAGCIANMALFWNLPTGGLIASLNAKANPKKV